MKTLLNNCWKAILLSPILALSLVGCGVVDEGNVGSRETWDGKIVKEEVSPGFYTAWTSSVREYTTKEFAIELRDMQPKAADNLKLQELDLDVYFMVAPSQISELRLKYAGRDAYSSQIKAYVSAYELVKGYARAAVYDSIKGINSLDAHRERSRIEAEVADILQSKLDLDDKGTFTVTKVIVRQVVTDPSLEKAITAQVAKEKELEAKAIELEIAKQQVFINQALDKSLTPNILQQRTIDVWSAAVENGAQVHLIMGEGGGGVQPFYTVK